MIPQLQLEPERQGRVPDLEVELPWPPSANRLYQEMTVPPRTERMREQLAKDGWKGFYRYLQRSTRVRRRLHQEGQDFRDACAWLIRGKARGQRWGRSRIVALVVVHPRVNGFPDTDNRVKAVFDALEYSGLIDNDRQIVSHRVDLGEVIPKVGGIDLKLWRLT